LKLKDLIFLFDEIDFSENIFYSIICSKSNTKKKKEISEEKMDFENEERITIDDLILNTVRFYSMRMLVIHLDYLNSVNPEMTNLVMKEFEETHQHDSLSEYIKDHLTCKGKFTISNLIDIKNNSLNFVFKKFVVVSYSDSNHFGLTLDIKKKSTEMTVNTLNQKGTEYMTEKLEEFIDNKNKKLLIIRFEKKNELVHFKYIKQFLNSFETSNKNRNINKRTKMIIILIHKPFTKKDMKNDEKFDSGITFGYPQPDWEYNVIENLSGSNYK
jgi:hypothetical protein